MHKCIGMLVLNLMHHDNVHVYNNIESLQHAGVRLGYRGGYVR